MAKCRFCGTTSLVWKDLNEPAPATVAPPGSTLEQITEHNRREHARLTQSIREAPKWQLTDRTNVRHSCELSRFYYREATAENKAQIDRWLRTHPEGTTRVTDALAPIAPATSPPTTQIVPFPPNQPPPSLPEIFSAQLLTAPVSQGRNTWAGKWNEFRTYNVHEVVVYRNGFYYCRTFTRAGIKPGNATYWGEANEQQVDKALSEMGIKPELTLEKPKIDLEKRSIKI